MANNNLCPYCDNKPPYYLATITLTKTLTMNKIIELTDENIRLKAENYQLKKIKAITDKQL